MFQADNMIKYMLGGGLKKAVLNILFMAILCLLAF